MFKNISETLRSYDYKTVNFRLIIYVIALTVLGISVINSASGGDVSLVRKQILGLAIGAAAMIFLSLVRYEFIARYYWIIYLGALVFLGAVLTPLGHSSGGAQRWFKIGDSFTIQPSEFCKIFLLIFFSAFLVKNRQMINSWKFLLFTFVLIALPIFLILREPDLSTSIVTLLMICVIIFMSDIQAKYIRRILYVAVPALAGIIALIVILPAENNIISRYQYNRIIGFYDSENEVAKKINYQQENSVLAIAGGGLTGKGLNNDSVTSVKNADFISAPETDFIFTIIGEELGFIGSMAVLILLFLIVIECIRTGMRARENIGRSISIGFGALIGFQTIINLAVVTRLIPNTGLTLPFVSAGMSSLIVLYMGVGIVLNTGLRMKNTL